MSGPMRTRKRLWRWRRSPLRRATDVVEAWVVMVLWVGVTAGSAVAGLLVGLDADRGFAAQRADRHRVEAVLTADAPRSGGVSAGSSGRVAAEVRWTGADGVERTGMVPVEPGRTEGTSVVVWTDGAERLLPEPPTRVQAAVRSAVTGAMAALVFGACVVAAACAVRASLDRHRMKRWAAEWERVGPRWGHRKI